jgi:solute carrier family 44 (choline transporter-like protein), member 2/4/5
MLTLALCLHRLGCGSQTQPRPLPLWALLVPPPTFRNCEVAIALCQFIIASTAAYWYFSHLGNATFPLAKSICRAFTYQLGSLIFGGLVLCVMWMLQIMLEVLEYTVKSHTVSGNPASNACFDFCLKCARCCLACFERFVRFLTHNAFLMMAISGEGFCSSAHQAFYLAMRSAGEYAITHGVGHTLMFFGKLLVSVLVTLFTYILAANLNDFKEDIYSPLTPAVVHPSLSR